MNETGATTASRSSLFRRLTGNVGWLIANRLVRMAVGVFVIGYISRYLGVVDFGKLNYALSLVMIFATVASLGIDGIVIRELVRLPARTAEVLGTAFVLRLIGAGSAVAVVFLMSFSIQQGDALRGLMLAISSAFIPQAFEVIELWFQKNIDARATIPARLIALFLSSGLRVFLVFVEAPLLWFGYAYLAESALSSWALILVLQKRGEKLSAWRVDWSLARLIVKDSWPLILSGILVAVYMRVEQLMVMSFLGSKNVGIYFSAVRLSEMWNFVPTIILATVYPLLAAAKQQNPAKYRADFQFVFDALTILGVVIAVVVTFSAGWLIDFIFGKAYREAVPVLIIQAWTAPIVFNSSVRASFFLTENLNQLHIWSACLGVAVNFTIAVHLIPDHGTLGAALGALAGFLASGYLTSFLFKRARECASIQTNAFLFPFRLMGILQKLRNFK